MGHRLKIHLRELSVECVNELETGKGLSNEFSS